MTGWTGTGLARRPVYGGWVYGHAYSFRNLDFRDKELQIIVTCAKVDLGFDITVTPIPTYQMR